MSLKTRLAALEAARYERELDRCVRYLAERYGLPVAEVRSEIDVVLARRQAGGGLTLSPDERQQAEALRQEMEQWEASRG